MSGVQVKCDLFKDVKYYVTGTINPEIQKLLENGGASSTKIMFTNITHLLCGSDFDEKDICEATDIYDIPSVNGEWVKACVRLGRLACPKLYHPIPNGIFTPIVAAVVQLNQEDRKKLYALITFHGGRVERNFTSNTTHLICGCAIGDVYTKAMNMQTDKFSIVTPDWFYECLKIQELIDPKPFHPRLLKPASQINSNDAGRSLRDIIGLSDSKPEIKRTEPVKSVSEINAKQTDPVQIIPKNISNTMTNQISSVSAAPAATFQPIDEPKTTEQLQTKMTDNTYAMQRITTTQTLSNQPKPIEQSLKEKMEQIQPQHTAQVSKPITQSTPTQMTPVNSHLLQKQLEQPLKMDNANVGMQQAQYNQPQMQHFQVVQQKPTILQNQQQTMMQTQQMMNQVKIDQPNQIVGQKQVVNSLTLQGQQNMQTHVQNVIPQPQNQIQIQPIQQQQQQIQPQQIQQQQQLQLLQQPQQLQQIQHQQQQMQQPPQQLQQQQQQPNQMQQIGIDQSGQIQFMNSVPPGTPTNFNAVQQNQQMKVVHNVQQTSMQQPTQQFIVQSPGPNKTTILNQNVVFINQSGQQQIITSSQQQGNNVALVQQQQRNMNTSQQPMQIQGQQILIHSSVQQPTPNQIMSSPQQQTQFIVQTSPGQGTGMNQSPNQRMQKTPGGTAANWFLQQQQHQQQQQPPQQQPGMVQSSDATQNVSPQQMQNMQQKLIQQSPGANQQIAFTNMQNADHSEGVMGQQHNQTIMITGNQAQPQQPPQTPPIQQVNAQGMMQNQGQMQKMHVQNQQIVLTPSQSPQHGNIQMQSMSQQQQKPLQQTPPVNVAPGQAQFIRAARPQWPGNQQGPQRQLIHLDAQTHAHLQTLDPIQRAEYLAKLQKRNLLFRQQGGFIQQGSPVGAQQRPPNHIIARPQIPGTPIQWMQQQPQQQQQQQQRPLVVRGAAPGLSPISQQTIVSPGGNIGTQQSPVPQQQFQDPNAPPQFQRVQIQQATGQKPMPQANMVVPVQKPFPENTDQQQQASQVGIMQQQANVDGATTQVQMNKTKTALANMLSNRLSHSGSNGAGITMQATDAQPIVEPSAAGTLRMISAQHNSPAPQGQQQFQVDPSVMPQFQRIQIQQVPGQKPMPQANMIVTAQKPFQEAVDQQLPANQLASVVQLPAAVDGTSPQIQLNKAKPAMIQSPSGMKSPPFSPNRPLPRPQFYGHNPNLKLPPEVFLLGCIFYIVEYDESNASDISEWKKLIQHHGGEVETVYCPRVTHVLCRTQRHGVVMQAIRDSKRCVTAYWLNDTIIRMQVQPPSEALHLPMPSTFGTQRPATKHIISVSGFEGEERSRVKQMVEESGALLTPYFTRHNSVLISKKLEGNKYKRAKDWNIPVVNCVWLSDILQGNLTHIAQYDQQKYQQYNLSGPLRIDHSLVAHLMNAWKSPINLTQDSYERVKRLNAEPAANEPKPKKIRKYEPLEVLPEEIVCNEKPEQVPQILFSQVDNLDGLKNAVTSLGGELVTEPENATHLVLTHLVRTYKLLFALCTVDHIVSSKWIVDSAKAGKFLRPDEYTLNDEQFRKSFNCDIQEVITSTTRKTLFAGKTFFVTPSVRPKHKDVVKLIEFCSGKVESKRRSAAQIAQANAQQPDTYIILTCTSDLHLVHDLLKAGKPNRIICSTELVLTAIMHQKVDFEPHVITYDRPKI